MNGIFAQQIAGANVKLTITLDCGELNTENRMNTQIHT